MATSRSEAELEKEDESASSEEESDGSESSFEDQEPKLRYDRLSNDVTGILQKDCASCMAVHSRFLALGTHWGNIHILDYQGNLVKGKEYPSGHIAANVAVINKHTTTVNQISIDDQGEYIATCSDDGKVNVTGLYSSESNQSVNFDRPVKSVAIDPGFASSNGKQFVTGDDKLILHEKGFFSRHKATVLHSGEGPVREIQWKGDFIAWSNDVGVKIYDLSLKSRITFVAKDHNQRPDLCHCCLYWKDDRTLLIGWADTVKVCLVKDRKTQDVRDLPSRFVEIVAMFKTDFLISGISALNENIVALTFEKDKIQEGGKLISQRPNLRILEAHMEHYEELSNDALSIRGYQNLRSNDYHLESVSEDNLFYIVSPKDVVVARQRDEDDHIAWLLQHEKYEEAMDATIKNGKELKKHNFQDVGRLYMNCLIEEEEYDKAANLCVKLFGKNKEMWENEAYKFASIRQLKVLAPYLPHDDPRLSPAIYEMVLNEFLQLNHETFLQMIKEWPHTLYNIKTIINVVIEKLDKDRNNQILLQALAELHGYEKAFDKALAIYLKLKHKDVFILIHKHNLFESISDKIVQLMEFDQEQAVNMLLDNINQIPVEKVVRQLEKKQWFLHIYLDRLFKKEPQLVIPYSGDMVKLYAEFDQPKLLPFLKSSNNYQLDMALHIMETRELVPEQVYLLGLMGNIKQALHLITDKLRNVDQAIEFCKEHNDSELWEDLIEHSIDKPNFITGLLNSIGTHVDPIILIRRIQTGMEIPGLRDSLVKILQDYNLQISLREGCKKILVADSFGLMRRLVKTQKKAISVETSHICQVCQERVLVTGPYSLNIGNSYPDNLKYLIYPLYTNEFSHTIYGMLVTLWYSSVAMWFMIVVYQQKMRVALFVLHNDEDQAVRA